MKRTTVSLPNQLHEAIERYQRDQEVPLPLSALVQAALREYLSKRGYPARPEGGAFHITPAAHGSGARDVSAEHDRYFAEARRSR